MLDCRRERNIGNSRNHEAPRADRQQQNPSYTGGIFHSTLQVHYLELLCFTPSESQLAETSVPGLVHQEDV